MYIHITQYTLNTSLPVGACSILMLHALPVLHSQFSKESTTSNSEMAHIDNDNKTKHKPVSTTLSSKNEVMPECKLAKLWHT